MEKSHEFCTLWYFFLFVEVFIGTRNKSLKDFATCFLCWDVLCSVKRFHHLAHSGHSQTGSQQRQKQSQRIKRNYVSEQKNGKRKCSLRICWKWPNRIGAVADKRCLCGEDGFFLCKDAEQNQRVIHSLTLRVVDHVNHTRGRRWAGGEQTNALWFRVCFCLKIRAVCYLKRSAQLDANCNRYQVLHKGFMKVERQLRWQTCQWILQGHKLGTYNKHGQGTAVADWLTCTFHCLAGNWSALCGLAYGNLAHNCRFNETSGSNCLMREILRCLVAYDFSIVNILADFAQRVASIEFTLMQR